MLNIKTLPITISGILLFIVAVILSQDLATGKNLHYDEFYGLERSIGFDKYRDWFSVYSLNKPCAKKPPLQYWLIAINMRMGLPELLSLRLWSYIFLLGVIILTAFTSYYLCQDNPWAISATILLISCSTKLIVLGRSGMLDAGMSFWVMASLLALFYAKGNPKWWIICGLAIGFGALQKAPVAFLFVVIILFILNVKGEEDYSWPKLRKNRFFNCGYYLSLFLLLSWPIFQTFRHGLSYFHTSFKKEMITRFSPIGTEKVAVDDHFVWVGWLWADIHFISLVALLCLLMIFLFKKWRDNNFLFAIAILIGLICLFFSLATGKIYSRYLVVLTPLLIILVVKVINDISQWQPMVFCLGIVSFFFAIGNIQLSLDAINGRDSFTRAKEITMLIDTYRKDNDKVLTDKSAVPAGAYGYFGQSKLPYYAYWFNRDRDLDNAKRVINKSGNSLIGASLVGSKERISKMADGFIELERFEDVMIWKICKPHVLP